MGGFARRTSFWNAFAKKFPSKPFLKIDGGSLFSNGPAESPIVNRWMIEGTYRSGLDALNLTAWDLPVWQELGDLASVGQVSAEWLKLPLVSANVKARLPNFPAIQRYVIREIPIDQKSGRRLRIAITGLLFDTEERIPRDQFEIGDPEQAARKVIEELTGKSDFRILLTDTTIGKAMSLGITVPGIHVIVVAHNYAVASDPVQAGEALIITPVNEGRVVSEIRLALDGASQKVSLAPRFVPLDRTVPDDPAMADLERKAQAQLEAFKKGRAIGN